MQVSVAMVTRGVDINQCPKEANILPCVRSNAARKDPFVRRLQGGRARVFAASGLWTSTASGCPPPVVDLKSSLRTRLIRSMYMRAPDACRRSAAIYDTRQMSPKTACSQINSCSSEFVFFVSRRLSAIERVLSCGSLLFVELTCQIGKLHLHNVS